MDQPPIESKTESDSYLTIGQLSRRVGMRASALRYYEEQGLLQPAKRTAAGYRLYGPEAEEALLFIRRAQRLGFSLKDIQVLLGGWQTGEISAAELLRTAEARYLALEREVTQMLVLRHEMGLFLQDLYNQAEQHIDRPARALLGQFIDRVCTNPPVQPAPAVFDWLVAYTGCRLTTEEGQRLLDELRGQHVHIWQEDGDYKILVVSEDPAVGEALAALAELESGCLAHAHTSQAPELLHDGEGYLVTARGENGFIFARLFLALEEAGNGGR